MQFPRNGDHPVVWIRWHCDVAVESGGIAVIVVESDRTRTLTLRNAARDVGGVFLTCHATRSGKQFLRLVAESLSIRGSDLDSFELYEKVRDALGGSKTPLFFDRAELLTNVPLEMVLEIVKSCQTGF